MGKIPEPAAADAGGKDLKEFVISYVLNGRLKWGEGAAWEGNDRNMWWAAVVDDYV